MAAFTATSTTHEDMFLIQEEMVEIPQKIDALSRGD